MGNPKKKKQPKSLAEKLAAAWLSKTSVPPRKVPKRPSVKLSKGVETIRSSSHLPSQPKKRAAKQVSSQRGGQGLQKLIDEIEYFAPKPRQPYNGGLGSSQAANNLQQQMNRQMNNQLANLQQQLNQRGAGQAAMAINRSSINYSPGQIWNNPGAAGVLNPKKPMQPLEPPKYLQGYKVTIRQGKTVWTVHHWEERTDPYRGPMPTRYYYLENDSGQQTREMEDDLHIHDGISSTKAVVDFDTVVIEDEKRQQILEALEQVAQQDLIFNKWGFGETIEKGKGVSMLFYGPPGTGKTLMAQAIANKLNYVLKVISTADIESSAPGEAERNIRKHFKEAKGGKSILLFDECDSLIYTRQNVGPILGAQINELLSQIERFEGITLFTTNRLGTLDEAVNRRLALKLEFSMPTQDQRAEIWKRMFPKQAPLDEKIDWSRLAIVEITGGYIKNAVLRAARMAAIEKIPDDKKKIKMQHLVKALTLETQSMVEFENAREEQKGNIGEVSMGTNGQRVVRKRRAIERSSTDA